MPGGAWLMRLDWRVRAPAMLAGLTLLFTLALAGAGLWHRPGFIVAAAFIAASCLTILAFGRARDWLERMDWRVAAILLATALSLAVTFIGFDLGWEQEPGGFLHDVFAGWVAGIAFFGFVGLVVALVSLARPEEEAFDRRARILFRGQDGRHIEYIVSRIRETLEHYAESVSHVRTIRDYDTAEQKFLLDSEMETLVRSYLDDIRTTYNSELRMEELTAAPAGKPANRLVYLRVGERVSGSKPIVGNSIVEPLDTVIEARGTCMVAYGIEYWVQADRESHSYAPARYTQRVRLRLRNRLAANQVVHVRLTRKDGSGLEEHSLGPGEERTICEVADVRPGEQVYEFTIAHLT